MMTTQARVTGSMGDITLIVLFEKQTWVASYKKLSKYFGTKRLRKENLSNNSFVAIG